MRDDNLTRKVLGHLSKELVIMEVLQRAIHAQRKVTYLPSEETSMD
jgi:hypothetical protein